MRINPDVVFRSLGDGAVLVNLVSNHIFELNDTGIAIWSELADGSSREAIIASLVSSFDIDPDAAGRQLDDFLSELETSGLVLP